MSYQVYKAAWPWATLKVQKRCIKINLKRGRNCDVKKILVKLQHGTCNFWGVIAFTRSFELGLDWKKKFKNVTQRSTSNLTETLMRRTSLPVKLQHDAVKFWAQWSSSKSQKGWTKVNIKFIPDFDVENISVELQHDGCNSWGVIVFTRQPDLEQVWKFKKVTQRSISNLSDMLMWRTPPIKLQHHTSNTWEVIAFTKQLDFEPVWKFKKVTQRSTSNSLKICMWRTLLSSYNLIQAIYEEFITFTRSFQMLSVWKFKKVTQRSTSKLTYCIIIFMRSCKMLPFEHDLVQKVQKVNIKLVRDLMSRIPL